MFLYYALHSTANQLRRFVRTWAFFLLVGVAVFGGIVWHVGRWYYQRLVELDAALPQDLGELYQASGLTATNVLELTVGLAILGVLILQVIDAERSMSLLFMQADVNMLFASPRSPQEILAFRVISTLGLPMAALPFMLLGVPRMAASWDVSLSAAATVPLAWCLTLGFSTLFKILAYELGSRHPVLRRNLRWAVMASLGLVGLLLYRTYTGVADRDLLLAAHLNLNAPWTRAVPVWGWVKGMVALAFDGKTSAAGSLLALSLCVLGVLAFVASHARADYYEETLSRAEEAARFRQQIASDNVALLAMEMSQRTGRAWREGFTRGCGASVYFFKVLHQRQRFARFGFVTKTMVTYLFVAVAAGLFAQHFMDERLPYLPALLLSAMVFFRTIVSPVAEDVRKDSFLLLPEPIWAKLLFSLLGGSCNCVLDTAVPLMVGSAVMGLSPLQGLLYLPAVASADFFASASGIFADVTIPPSIGVSLKQVAQVLLLYFGLIFDGMVITYSVGSGHPGFGFFVVFILNLLFGATFLGLAGVWLYPCHGRPAPSRERVVDANAARHAYSRMGLALAGMFVAVYGTQLLLAGRVAPLIAVYLPLYGIGLPAFLLLAGRGGMPPANRRLRPRLLLAYLPACLFLAYGGNLLGYALRAVLDAVIPLSLMPRLAELPADHVTLQVALVTLASPLMEELVFRRCLIDCLAPFGERSALVASALAFGLFHASANQFCYGLLLGGALGYVYLRTGRLRYSVVLHVTINVMTAVVLPALLLAAEGAAGAANPQQVQLASVILEPGVLALLAYLALLFVLALLGAVLCAFGVREHDLSPDGITLSTSLLAPGMVFFELLALAAML